MKILEIKNGVELVINVLLLDPYETEDTVQHRRLWWWRERGPMVCRRATPDLGPDREVLRGRWDDGSA